MSNARTAKTRTWACCARMNQNSTVTTVGGTRKEAKRQAVAEASANLRWSGRVVATLLTES